MQGQNGMGYCPFSVLGHDLEMASRQDGPGVHNRARWPGARLSGMCATVHLRAQPGFRCVHYTDPRPQVAPSIFVSRRG